MIRAIRTRSLCLTVLAALTVICAQAQTEPEPGMVQGGPIAIVSLDSKNPDAVPSVSGALQLSAGKAMIVASGTVTSNSLTTDVILPRRGVLHVCASTTVKLAADSSVPAGETPGLMMAFDHGAVEASFATGRNSDILLTPDFRILIGGPGAADVKVRLGQHGDTCVDNAGTNTPYILVTSVFDGGDYQVKAGQRVMFQHGSVHEVVDDEKEPCGCPPAVHPGTNEFPLAESAGLAPPHKPAPTARENSSVPPQAIEPLIYKSADRIALSAAEARSTAEGAVGAAVQAGSAPAAATEPDASKSDKKKHKFLHNVGHFFHRVFGSE